MSNQGLPERIIEARKIAGMRQENLAAELGVSFNTIRNWETGRTTPQLGYVSDLSAALGVDLVWLLEGDGLIEEVA